LGSTWAIHMCDVSECSLTRKERVSEHSLTGNSSTHMSVGLSNSEHTWV